MSTEKQGFLKQLFGGGSSAPPQQEEQQSDCGVTSVSFNVNSTYSEVDAAELRAATKARTTLFESRVDLMVGADPTELASTRGTNVCPACGTVFEGELKSSRKCPECKQKIVVRSKDGSKLLLTEAESDLVGTRKKALADLRKAHDRVKYFEVSAEQFLATLDELGAGYSPRDASWRILNEQMADAIRCGSYSDMSFIYSTMARQLLDEGKDFSDSLNMSAECGAQAEWLQAKELGIDNYEGLRISSCNCSVCATDDGRLVRWDELEPTPRGLSGPLPHLNCESGICHCMYQIYSATFGE
jgi:predicted RNA-binding Zn-ribbon protein involved in translation (DUF1610 family)